MAKGVALLGSDHRFVTLAVVPPVFVPTASMSPMDNHPTLEDPELEQELEDEQRAEQDSEVHELDALLGISAEHLVETGEPGPTICDVAVEVGADVIVVAAKTDPKARGKGISLILVEKDVEGLKAMVIESTQASDSVWSGGAEPVVRTAGHEPRNTTRSHRR